jgi:hypothetical protein
MNWLFIYVVITGFVFGWTLNMYHTADLVYKTIPENHPIKNNISMTKNYVDVKDWGGSPLPCMMSFYYLDTHIRMDRFNCQV